MSERASAGAPGHLLGRHVSDGAHHHAGLGHGHGAFGGRGGLVAGEPEVEDLRAAVARQHDVFGFEVAMNHAGGMGRGESVGDLGGEIDGLA